MESFFLSCSHTCQPVRRSCILILSPACRLPESLVVLWSYLCSWPWRTGYERTSMSLLNFCSQEVKPPKQGFLWVSCTWPSCGGAENTVLPVYPHWTTHPSMLLAPEPSLCCQREVQWSGSSDPHLQAHHLLTSLSEVLCLFWAHLQAGCSQISHNKHLGKESWWERFSWQAQNTSTVRSY